ncbi:MAG: hypothetical protein JO189_04100 [Deltaproteobacteria bacterium]|nr:hypothetical protein [Deltaproteobacteria bacterium]
MQLCFKPVAAAQFQDATVGQSRGGGAAPCRHEFDPQLHCTGAYYRRLAARLGPPKAITATARKLAILVDRVLRGELAIRTPESPLTLSFTAPASLTICAVVSQNSA